MSSTDMRCIAGNAKYIKAVVNKILSDVDLRHVTALEMVLDMVDDIVFLAGRES